MELPRQRASWDCGLACADGVLRAAGARALPDALWARVERAGRSVWTVDVAELLARRGLGLTLYTALAGVDPAHARRAFYGSLDRDEERVPRKFAALARVAERRAAALAEARAGAAGSRDGAGTAPAAAAAPAVAAVPAVAAAGAAGAACASGAAPPDDEPDPLPPGAVAVRAGARLAQPRMLRLLARGRAAFLALVDARFLACARCAPAAAAAAAAAPGAEPAGEYRGHFVVLTGVSRAGDVEYADPAAGACAGALRCAIEPARLERARSSPGTDDDVIELGLPLRTCADADANADADAEADADADADEGAPW